MISEIPRLIDVLSVHEEMEVERNFHRLKDQGYIPEGQEDQYLARMMAVKAIEVSKARV